MKRHTAKAAEISKGTKAHNTAQLRKAESTPFFFSFVMLWQGMMLLLQRILRADEASASMAYCLVVSILLSDEQQRQRSSLARQGQRSSVERAETAA